MISAVRPAETAAAATAEKAIPQTLVSGTAPSSQPPLYRPRPVVITTGEGRGVSVKHGYFRFAFNDLFTFRDGLIARVDSYVVPLP